MPVRPSDSSGDSAQHRDASISNFQTFSSGSPTPEIRGKRQFVSGEKIFKRGETAFRDTCSAHGKKMCIFCSALRVFGRSLRGSIFSPALPVPASPSEEEDMQKLWGCALSEKVSCQISEMTFQKFFLKGGRHPPPLFFLDEINAMQVDGPSFPKPTSKKSNFSKLLPPSSYVSWPRPIPPLTPSLKTPADNPTR